MDFKFGVLLVVSAHFCISHALPPCVCTRNYQPICGSDGQTYSNQCMMECEQKHITVVREGRCEDELIDACICNYNYLPVCGNDGVTYPNKCSLDCQRKRTVDLEMSHEGTCGSNLPQEPPCVCTREKKPVCGSDGATYSNDCLLNCATKDNPMLSIEHFGPCTDKVKVAEGLKY